MMTKKSSRKSINRLYDIRNCFDRTSGAEKQSLVECIRRQGVRTAADAKKLHKALCFIRAFPDTPVLHQLVSGLLASFDELIDGLAPGQKHRLSDSGIRSTDIHYSFSFEVATWLARKYPGRSEVDWDELEDACQIDELIEQLLEPAEVDYFNSGEVTAGEWLAISAENLPGTDFDWLMAQLRERREYESFWAILYNAADVPLRCSLSNSELSISANVFETGRVSCRNRAMQSRVTHAKKQIASPLRTVIKLDRKSAARLIDVAMASLAVRHRETLHFNYANADEVYLADVGRGVQIAVTGLQTESRYPLETTMGFLILSNGVPIGYGGASVLYRQVNTGINIFDEYRGSEAAWLWVQVMRVFHSLTGCNRYIANPYQFGSENSEALQSGAFWFYYRLGYRPVEPVIRLQARQEFSKIRSDRRYRTPLRKLRELAACDMHLMLPGASKKDFFDEACIEKSGVLATRQLADTAALSRRKARQHLCRHLADILNIRDLDNWTVAERKWLSNLGPLIAATDPGRWSTREKRALVKMIRAKGGEAELDYARKARNLGRFFSSLKKVCGRITR